MGKRLGIWGWWQGNNLGDNWIKNVLKSFFPSAEFLPTSVQDFNGYDYIICGGGGLFIYDVISPFKEHKLKVPYGILGMGAEFEHDTDTALKISKEADFFYVRDQYSVECMHLPKECKSYDITFLKPLPLCDEVNLENLYLVWREGRDLIKNDKFKEYIRYDDVFENWNKVIEKNFSCVKKNDFQTSDWNLLDDISDSGFVISGRYHGIVAAIQRGIPFIAIDICPKIRALVKECGLEEYCIKISEIEKVDSLIKRAKSEIEHIRKKEMRYRKEAQITLLNHMAKIRKIIYKKLNPISIIHYGSYWMQENDVINVMATDLMELAKTLVIDLKEYSKTPDDRIENILKTPNGTVCHLNTEKVIADVEQWKPDAIILNSGGLCMDIELANYLKNKNVITVGIALSDPDVYPYNGAVYAHEFDIFYTNSLYSYKNQYDKGYVNIKMLPFAASMKYHYYMPEVEKKYDLVVVGHAREERLNVIERLKDICSVGLYGSGWINGLGVVNGYEHVKAINSGRMYLSFAQTCAGFENVKVGLFEAMACNQFVITSYMEELNNYFEIGKEIVCYSSLEELEEIIKYYMIHVEERERIRQAGYIRFISEHTYENRWINVLNDIIEMKNIRS